MSTYESSFEKTILYEKLTDKVIMNAGEKLKLDGVVVKSQAEAMIEEFKKVG